MALKMFGRYACSIIKDIQIDERIFYLFSQNRVKNSEFLFLAGRVKFLAEYGVLFLCRTKRDETLTEAQILRELNVQVMTAGKD